MFPALTKANEAGNALSHAGFTRTGGGHGGRIVRVTNLAGAGPGSLAAALTTKGPRVIVFEVGGVIDLKGKGLEVSEPLVTVAGQTAPSPGITLIRGGLKIATHDVILQHLRIRPGAAGRAKGSGWEVDGLSTAGDAHDVLVDHLSCTWATDENLSASGPRFSGASPEDWRKATSHRTTIRNCIIAEGLSHSTHAKGEHSKGSLIHDNATDIAILGNLFANNVQRNPLFKGGARGIVVNNLIVNPGNKAIHFGLVPDEWVGHAWEPGRMAVISNLLLGGADTSRNLALMTHARGPLVLHLRDNRAQNKSGGSLPIYETQAGSGTTNGCELINQPPLWPEGLLPLPVDQVKEAVLTHAGARPWDRDAIDQRIIAQAQTGTGRIIDSETAVGGYPKPEPTRASFHPEDWNLETLERINPPLN
jgi:pectate lyase